MDNVPHWAPRIRNGSRISAKSPHDQKYFNKAKKGFTSAEGCSAEQAHKGWFLSLKQGEPVSHLISQSLASHFSVVAQSVA